MILIAEPTEPLTLINTYGAWPVIQPQPRRASRLTQVVRLAAVTVIVLAILAVLVLTGAALLTTALLLLQLLLST